MQNDKQQPTEAVLAIARDVEKRAQELGERVATLFTAVEEARGSGIRLSHVLSIYMANVVRGLHTTSHWSEPLPPMNGFLDAVRWSLHH